MGSSGEDPSKVIDASVGALVWVRRRNGSWWPGRIIGPDELPEGCMPTPRSGTPVKLLGREDASVDWYNLEKSKRVKPFRCGEYDDCIERAKASALHLSKKAVKYARREDAILHALDLESAHLGQDHPDLSPRPSTEDEERCPEESPSSSHPAEERKDIDKVFSITEDDSDSGPDLPESGISFEEPGYVDAIKEECKKCRTPNDSEDDGTEGVKRMRGLEDLGMGVAKAKRKRSQVTHVHEFLKRKNRRRTLTKVLECTAMVSVPAVCERLSSPTGPSVLGASDNKVLGNEPIESKSNNSDIVNNLDSTVVACENATSLNENGDASDASLISRQKENEISSTLEIPENESLESLFDVPLDTEVKTSAGLAAIVSGVPQKTRGVAAALSSQSSPIETLSVENEEHNESNFTNSGTTDIHSITQITGDSTSKWQLKGKRNSRSRKANMDNEAETHLVGISCCRIGGPLITNGGDNHVNSRPISEFPVEEFHGWSWNSHHGETHAIDSLTDLTASQRLLPYRQSRFSVNPKYDSSDFLLNHHTTNSGLCDVTVEVKTSQRPRHVPYISLMSKLNGRPIIGHPLGVEVLSDGFCDDLLLSVSEYYSCSSEFDYNLNNLSPCQGIGKRNLKNPSLHVHRAPTKSPKTKRNGFLSKKIKKLSSLTGSNQQSREVTKQITEKPKGPSIACVPLNVVFSRINAALKNSVRSAPLPTSA